MSRIFRRSSLHCACWNDDEFTNPSILEKPNVCCLRSFLEVSALPQRYPLPHAFVIDQVSHSLIVIAKPVVVLLSNEPRIYLIVARSCYRWNVPASLGGLRTVLRYLNQMGAKALTKLVGLFIDLQIVDIITMLYPFHFLYCHQCKRRFGAVLTATAKRMRCYPSRSCCFLS